MENKKQIIISCSSGDYDLDPTDDLFSQEDFDGEKMVTYNKETGTINLMIDFADKDVCPHFNFEQARTLRSALNWCLKSLKEPITYSDMQGNSLTKEDVLKIDPSAYKEHFLDKGVKK